MKKKIATLKKIKHLSFFFQSKNDWSNWSFYLYDPFFFLFVNFFIKNGSKKKTIHLVEKIFYLIKLTTRLSPIYVLKKAIYNSQLFLETIPVLQKNKSKKIRILFYKSKMYNSKKRIQKGISLLMEHVQLMKTKELFLHEKIVIAILNAFFKQGPVYDKVQQLYQSIGNINRKKRFYRQKNKMLHYNINRKKNRKMRNIKKRIHLRNRNKKKYSIYSVCYKFS
jgi:ribosomal protein S7